MQEDGEQWDNPRAMRALRVGKAGHGSRAGCKIPHRLLEAGVRGRRQGSGNTGDLSSGSLSTCVNICLYFHSWCSCTGAQ